MVQSGGEQATAVVKPSRKDYQLWGDRAQEKNPVSNCGGQ